MTTNDSDKRLDRIEQTLAGISALLSGAPKQKFAEEGLPAAVRDACHKFLDSVDVKSAQDYIAELDRAIAAGPSEPPTTPQTGPTVTVTITITITITIHHQTKQ